MEYHLWGGVGWGGVGWRQERAETREIGGKHTISNKSRFFLNVTMPPAFGNILIGASLSVIIIQFTNCLGMILGLKIAI